MTGPGPRRKLAALAAEADGDPGGEEGKDRAGMDARWGIGSCRGRRRQASGRTWTFIFLYAAMSLIVLGGSGRI